VLRALWLLFLRFYLDPFPHFYIKIFRCMRT
jgi:hypothetical protein